MRHFCEAVIFIFVYRLKRKAEIMLKKISGYTLLVLSVILGLMLFILAAEVINQFKILFKNGFEAYQFGYTIGNCIGLSIIATIGYFLCNFGIKLIRK